MNSFNKTEAAVFSCRLCFLRAFPFISLTKQKAIPPTRIAICVHQPKDVEYHSWIKVKNLIKFENTIWSKQNETSF